MQNYITELATMHLSTVTRIEYQEEIPVIRRDMRPDFAYIIADRPLLMKFRVW